MNASRPRMFGSTVEPGLLPWSWALSQLTTSTAYWIATTRPDGRPHTRPVWGVVVDGSVWFSTGSLAAGWLTDGTPMSLHTESSQSVVIIEGTAEACPLSVMDRVRSAYAEKYAEPVADLPTSWWTVAAETAFGWMAAPTFADGGATFHGTATRWKP